MNAKRFLTSLTLLLLAALLVFPLLMTLYFSFYAPEDAVNILEAGSPPSLTLAQYRHVLADQAGFFRYYRNASFYTAAILIGQAGVLPTMAYALSRFRFPGRDLLSFLVVVLLLLPFQVTMVPTVLVLRRLGLMDTVWAMILPAVASPFYLFLLRQHMLRIPDELFEAAQLDGAGTVRCFARIALPLSKSILLTALALSFADAWNMVEQPLVFLPGRSDLHPLSVVFSQLARRGTGGEFAGACLYILPTLLVYTLFQKHMMTGIQLSNLK